MIYTFKLNTDYGLHTAVIVASSEEEAKQIFEKKCEGFCDFTLSNGDYTIEEKPLQTGVISESEYL